MKNIITTTLLAIVLLSCGGEKKEDKSNGSADAAGVVQAPQKESTDNQQNNLNTDGMSDCDKFLNDYIDYCQKLVNASKKAAANLGNKAYYEESMSYMSQLKSWADRSDAMYKKCKSDPDFVKRFNEINKWTGENLYKK